MLKPLLVACAVLLIPGAALAEGAEKSICSTIGLDLVRCMLLPECIWDSTDQICERVILPPDFCAQFSTNITCEHDHPRCFWDSLDQRCETPRI
jgi:hypothetical protein